MALEKLIARERGCANNFEVEDKKAKENQELAPSIRQEAIETFAETRSRKLNENEEGTGLSARKKSRSSGSEPLVYLKEKIEKEKKVKRTRAGTEKKIRTARNTSANCPRSAKSTFN